MQCSQTQPRWKIQEHPRYRVSSHREKFFRPFLTRRKTLPIRVQRCSGVSCSTRQEIISSKIGTFDISSIPTRSVQNSSKIGPLKSSIGGIVESTASMSAMIRPLSCRTASRPAWYPQRHPPMSASLPLTCRLTAHGNVPKRRLLVFYFCLTARLAWRTRYLPCVAADRFPGKAIIHDSKASSQGQTAYPQRREGASASGTLHHWLGICGPSGGTNYLANDP